MVAPSLSLPESVLISVLLVILVSLLPNCFALYADDAGKFDTLLATTGHGAVDGVVFYRTLVITYNPSSSCYVAARRISDGSLFWRINACYQEERSGGITVELSNLGILVTKQQIRDGVVLKREWRVSDGSLIAEEKSSSAIAEENNSGNVGDGTCQGYSLQQTEDKEVAVQSPDGSLILKAPGTRFWMSDCSEGSPFLVLVSDEHFGTTTFLELPSQNQWTAEEGWGFISTGLILDDATATEVSATSIEALGFQARLVDQWKTLMQQQQRTSVFGFAKVAVFVSETYHRVWGWDTTTSALRYQMDVMGERHRLIHGSWNGAGAHPRDVMIVSIVGENELQWQCWDGTTGVIGDQGVVPVDTAMIQQILPVAGTDRNCHQGALVILQTSQVVGVNVDTEVVLSVEKGRRKLYAHYLDATLDSPLLQSMVVGKSTRPIGSVLFPNEKVLTVAYPSREQVVQSPCTVLGDNSLLLKYLNPHLMVVVTTVDPVDPAPKTAPKLLKPQGVGTIPQPATPPNLFINLVDSVAGRILYRVSHSNVHVNAIPVVVTISENWVFYAFVNKKTRKSELGVLSLYEGKIVKDGLTAFSTPEQSSTFSSLDAPEPIVLAKTFVLPHAVTAMGVTATKEGISGRRLVVAGKNGRLDAIDRKVLEPRRPVGKLKEDEKKEGLVQYHEVVPLVSSMALSYNRTVQGVTRIISVPTDLESQSMVLAFGGPDIFLVRTSPSRGFDLLPDSFNKALILIVVVAIAVAYLALQRVVARKIINQGWV